MKKRKYYALILFLALLLQGCGLSGQDESGGAGNTGGELAGEESAGGEAGSGKPAGSEAAEAESAEVESAGSAGSESGGGISDGAGASTDGSAASAALDKDEISGLFSSRDYEIGYDEKESVLVRLEGSAAACDSSAVQISGSTITLTEEGVYILSGTLADGMIVVDAEKTDKLQLVLDNVDIHSEDSAPITVLQADKVFLTLASGSGNTLSNGGGFTVLEDNNIDAVIFSKEDLTLNGEGSLTLESPAGHGIVSKDDLVITGGTYHITSEGHGLSGKDSVRIAGGDFTIASGKDGIHAENAEDESLGFLVITKGSFELASQGDGLSAGADLQIEDGVFVLETGGGSSAASGTQSSSRDERFQAASATDASGEAVSTKGIKAAGNLYLNGGSFTIDSADDSLHSNGNLIVFGGSCQIASGDDGLHADNELMMSGGAINISQSYEGMEGLNIHISGGEISLTSADDGLNAAGGADQSGFGGREGDRFASDSGGSIHISGGTLNINSSGDGIDSNGSLNVSGGQIVVSGPSGNGNSVLDYDTEAAITGGVFLASGSSEMAQSFGSSSTQGVMMVSVGSQTAGSAVELSDSSGQTILSWKAEKAFDCVIISCPELAQGSVYTLDAGNYTAQITMDSLVYGTSGEGGPGGMGIPGGRGGAKGGMQGYKYE